MLPAGLHNDVRLRRAVRGIPAPMCSAGAGERACERTSVTALARSVRPSAARECGELRTRDRRGCRPHVRGGRPAGLGRRRAGRPRRRRMRCRVGATSRRRRRPGGRRCGRAVGRRRARAGGSRVPGPDRRRRPDAAGRRALGARGADGVAGALGRGPGRRAGGEPGGRDRGHAPRHLGRRAHRAAVRRTGRAGPRRHLPDHGTRRRVAHPRSGRRRARRVHRGVRCGARPSRRRRRDGAHRRRRRTHGRARPIPGDTGRTDRRPGRRPIRRGARTPQPRIGRPAGRGRHAESRPAMGTDRRRRASGRGVRCARSAGR